MCVPGIGFQFHTPSTKEHILSEKTLFGDFFFNPKIPILGKYLGNDDESEWLNAATITARGPEHPIYEIKNPHSKRMALHVWFWILTPW